MRFSVNTDHVAFHPENLREATAAKELPLLLKAPRKPSVVANLIKRLGLNIKVQPFTLKELPSTFKFHTAPLPHQELALRFLYTFGGGGLLAEPGMGKTKIVLDFIHLMQFQKVVIVAPLPLLEVWEGEIVKHRPELRCHIPKKVSSAILEGSGVVNLLNYEKAKLLEKQIIRFKTDFLFLDEALIKDPTTARTKSMLRIAKTVPYRGIGSGTLVNNSPLDVFAPVQFVEPSLVGRSFTTFRDRYTDREDWMPHYMYRGFRDTEEISEIIEACSIVLRKDDWLKDLPKKQYFIENLTLPEEQRGVWDDLIRNKIAEVDGDYIEVDNSLSLFAKLAQISSGFIYKNDNVPFFFREQPKLDRVINLLRENGKRVILWFNYRAEGLMAAETLAEQGISFLQVDGRTKSVKEIVDKFNHGNDQVLLSQAKVLNYGQTILGDIEYRVDNSIYTQYFLSENWSLQVSRQQEDRTHRIGLKIPPSYTRFMVTPLDRDIRSTLENKRSVDREIMERIVNDYKTEEGGV